MHVIAEAPRLPRAAHVAPSRGDPAPFGYRPEIDGLRAIAVVAVIVNHLDAALLPSGFLGVDVFFTISGYVITRSLWRGELASLGALLSTFYARRVRRLLPALLACVIVTGVAASIVAVNPEPSLRTGVAALFGLSNLRLLGWATDYFAEPTALNTFTHTWSLGVEEQFYLLYPLLLWFLWLGRGGARNARALAISVGILSAASLAAFLLLGGQSRPLAFFMMPTRFWELGAGCLLFVLTEGAGRGRIVTSGTTVGELGAMALLALVVAAFFGVPAWASLWTVAAVAATTLLIGVLRPGTLAYRVLANRAALGIGVLSYSLYLWHWSVFSIARWTVGLSSATAPAALLLVIVLACASYWLVEKPLRTARWAPTTGRTLLYGGGAAIAAALVLVALRVPLRAPMQVLGERIVPLAYADPGILQKSLPCHLPAAVDDAFQRCMSRPAPSDRMVYVIGDSHASNHVPSIERALADARGVRVAYLVEQGFLNALTGVDSCLGYDACIDGGYEIMLRFLGRTLTPSDIVVFSWSRDRVTLAGPLPRRADEAALALLRTRLLELRDTVRQAGATLVLVDDIPKLCDHVLYTVDILRQGRLDRCDIAAADSRKDREGLSRLYRELRAPGVRLFDPHDALCRNGRCGMTLPESPALLYGDSGGHFTIQQRDALAAPWARFLAQSGSLSLAR